VAPPHPDTIVSAFSGLGRVNHAGHPNSSRSRFTVHEHGHAIERGEDGRIRNDGGARIRPDAVLTGTGERMDLRYCVDAVLAALGFQ
jgi:hypothetical protein